MKIPLIWLKDYVETNKSPQEIAAIFTQLGLMLDKPIDESNVLDLEQRLNRSDLLSIIGCTRDFAAFENIKLKMPKLTVKATKNPTDNDKININIHSDAVKRFQTRIFKNLTVKESPVWLKERLTAYGIEPKNNIVDITNFVMVEFAQPMHAQDLAKLKGRDITIRNAKPGEQLTTLLGTEVQLDEEVFVLTSGGEVTVIGGIVGGKNTGVSEATTEIILDAGNYDSRIVRKVSRKLKILNETVSRYDKFLDPRTIDYALNRATTLILELAGGECYTNDDYYPTPPKPQSMTLRYTRLHKLSGMEIPLTTIKTILKALEYSILEENNDSLTVEVPYFRTDVEVEDDLISDIVRVNNYQNIPLAQLTTPVPLDLTTDIYHFEDKLQDLLTAQGGHEHITNSLTTYSGSASQIRLVNALTSEQNALRIDLLDGLRHVTSTYTKHKMPYNFVYEIGKIFQISQEKYLEGRLLTALFPTHKDSSDSLATLFSSLGISSYHISKSHHLMIDGQLVGSVGHKTYTLVTDTLIKHTKSYTGIVSNFSHTTSLDLSLIAPKGTLYFDIVNCLSNLKSGWIELRSKAMPVELDQQINYLLKVTWPENYPFVEKDKQMILTTLKKSLNINSKS